MAPVPGVPVPVARGGAQRAPPLAPEHPRPRAHRAQRGPGPRGRGFRHVFPPFWRGDRAAAVPRDHPHPRQRGAPAGHVHRGHARNPRRLLRDQRQALRPRGRRVRDHRRGDELALQRGRGGRGARRGHRGPRARGGDAHVLRDQPLGVPRARPVLHRHPRGLLRRHPGARGGGPPRPVPPARLCARWHAARVFPQGGRLHRVFFHHAELRVLRARGAPRHGQARHGARRQAPGPGRGPGRRVRPGPGYGHS
mmetsp:Transcript_15442/g.52097  ORF Transcript_15442/g.52097 Transcript_15442/m.52097 type:complete len:252 (+) Transcript_15442:850-1605(+)